MFWLSWFEDGKPSSLFYLSWEKTDWRCKRFEQRLSIINNECRRQTPAGLFVIFLSIITNASRRNGMNILGLLLLLLFREKSRITQGHKCALVFYRFWLRLGFGANLFSTFDNTHFSLPPFLPKSKKLSIADAASVIDKLKMQDRFLRILSLKKTPKNFRNDKTEACVYPFSRLEHVVPRQNSVFGLAAVLAGQLAPKIK